MLLFFGKFEWDLSGVGICDEISLYPEIVSDGSGGAIIVWQDYRSGSNLDIYAQRVNSSGISQWGVNGICICNAVGNQTHQDNRRRSWWCYNNLG